MLKSIFKTARDEYVYYWASGLTSIFSVFMWLALQGL